MYVAVKGGEAAIDASHELLDERRRGDSSLPELTVAQIEEQLTLAVDRVMTEGGLFDRELAALAVKQARGDLIEAIFLLRAYRTTLPRFLESEPVDTNAMLVERRISATFKDLPGGQILGPTFDYTHRLLDFGLLDSREGKPISRPDAPPEPTPRVLDLLGDEGLVERPAREEGPPGGGAPGDLTRTPMSFPCDRDVRLQSLARADEGFVLGIAYSSQRGYGHVHPFAGEIRQGEVLVEVTPPELGFPIAIGRIAVTECHSVNQFKGSDHAPPQFTTGYGLAFGGCERKAIAMAIADRALRAREFGEEISAPAQDEEFVLSHGDSVESSGFVQHLKLPHYVDFQSELDLLRRLRAAWRRPGEPA